VVSVGRHVQLQPTAATTTTTSGGHRRLQPTAAIGELARRHVRERADSCPTASQRYERRVTARRGDRGPER